MTAYQAACWALGFLLALYAIDWALGKLPALARAHRRGLERVAFYDEARRQAAIAVAMRRHPAGYLPTGPLWVDLTDRVRSVSFPIPPLPPMVPLPPLRFSATWHPRDHSEA